MASEGDQVPALWKVNRTMHEMMKDRGYTVSDDEINMSLDAFRTTYASQTGSVECVDACFLDVHTVDSDYRRTQLNFFTNLRDNPTTQIFVYFTDEQSVGVKTMRKCEHCFKYLCPNTELSLDL